MSEMEGKIEINTSQVMAEAVIALPMRLRSETPKGKTFDFSIDCLDILKRLMTASPRVQDAIQRVLGERKLIELAHEVAEDFRETCEDADLDLGFKVGEDDDIAIFLKLDEPYNSRFFPVITDNGIEWRDGWESPESWKNNDKHALSTPTKRRLKPTLTGTIKAHSLEVIQSDMDDAYSELWHAGIHASYREADEDDADDNLYLRIRIVPNPQSPHPSMGLLYRYQKEIDDVFVQYH